MCDMNFLGFEEILTGVENRFLYVDQIDNNRSIIPKLNIKALNDTTCQLFVLEPDFVHFVKSRHPSQFRLHQNYPNPFNARTTISFDLPQPGNAMIDLYNCRGENLLTVINGFLSAGNHKRDLDLSEMPGGLYYCQI